MLRMGTGDIIHTEMTSQCAVWGQGRLLIYTALNDMQLCSLGTWEAIYIELNDL